MTDLKKLACDTICQVSYCEYRHKPSKELCKDVLAIAQRIIDSEWLKEQVAKARRAAAKSIGEYIDREIMRTDNRVTQLWVLGPLVANLKNEEAPHD